MLKTDLLVSKAEFRDVDEAEAVAHAHADARHEPGWQCNRNVFGSSFSLKNHLSFGLRFTTLQKGKKTVYTCTRIKIDPQAIFSRQNSSQYLFY